MVMWISDWNGYEEDPPNKIFAPKATNKNAKRAKAQYVYISRKIPMSAGDLMEDRIHWGESMILSEETGCDLIYEFLIDNIYELKKNFIQKENISSSNSSLLSRRIRLTLINKYRQSIMMRPLNDQDWSDDDLYIECKRLGLI